MRVVQHIAPFVSGGHPEDVEVPTIIELLALPWIVQWKETPEFIGFCCCYAEPGCHYLIAQMIGCHWVVAKVWGKPESLRHLPEWERPDTATYAADQASRKLVSVPKDGD